MTTELVELANRLIERAEYENREAKRYKPSTIGRAAHLDTRALLNEAAKAIRALASRAGGWLPIESAPKDHLPRLYLCRGRVVQGFVDVTDTLMVQHELGWRRMRRNPSHWRPLPTLPGKAIAALDSEESK